MAKISPRKLLFSSGNQHDIERDHRNNKWLTSQLIKALKLPPKQKTAIYAAAIQVNHTKPFITDFREFFPQFPVYVSVRERMPLRDNAGLANLFPLSKVLSQSFVRQFQQMLVEDKHEIKGRASAMLICWPPRMPVALHNMPVPREHPGVGFFITDGRKLRLTIEPLEQFVETVRLHLPEDF